MLPSTICIILFVIFFHAWTNRFYMDLSMHIHWMTLDERLRSHANQNAMLESSMQMFHVQLWVHHQVLQRKIIVLYQVEPPVMEILPQTVIWQRFWTIIVAWNVPVPHTSTALVALHGILQFGRKWKTIWYFGLGKIIRHSPTLCLPLINAK